MFLFDSKIQRGNRGFPTPAIFRVTILRIFKLRENGNPPPCVDVGESSIE